MNGLRFSIGLGMLIIPVLAILGYMIGSSVGSIVPHLRVIIIVVCAVAYIATALFLLLSGMLGRSD